MTTPGWQLARDVEYGQQNPLRRVFYCLQKGALPTAFEQVASSTFSASAVTFIDSALKIIIVI